MLETPKANNTSCGGITRIPFKFLRCDNLLDNPGGLMDNQQETKVLNLF